MAIWEDLGDGLVLRSIQDPADAVEFIRFNGTYNGLPEGRTCELLLNHHPGVAWDHFLMVTDTAANETAATACLIPWELRYGGGTLKTAMLEMILTHPDYRNRSLVKRQINRLFQTMEEEGFDLSVIWGIPYFYRQFGYTYCLYGDPGISVDLASLIGAGDAGTDGRRIRRARTQDIPALQRLYDAAGRGLDIYTHRNEPYWDYLISAANYPVHIVENGGGPEGYVVFRTQGEEAVILEDGLTQADTGRFVFNQLIRAGCRKAEIHASAQGICARIARAEGAAAGQPQQWLIRITNMQAFLIKSIPVFEKRLARSGHAGYTGEIIVNLYKQAFQFILQDGKITAVQDIGFRDSSMGADGGDLCIPPDAFVRLLLGFRTLEELFDAWPDIMVRNKSRSLIKALFPPMESYIQMPFHYFGDG